MCVGVVSMTIAFFRPGERHCEDSKNYCSAFSLLLLCFSLGCLVSSLFGDVFFSAVPFFSGDGMLTGNFVFSSFVFLVVAIFLATTFLGYILLPILSFFRGYLLSFTAATIIAGYQNSGVVMALTVIGIPALLTVPCYFVLASECFLYSRSQLMMVRNTPCAYKSRLCLYSALCLVLTAAAALLEVYLLPYLLSLMKG